MSINVSSADRFFEILEQHGVSFPMHVRNILTKVGYSCVQSFAQLNNEEISEIESVVKTTFANSLTTMDEAEKKELFGPNFFTNPSTTFKLLPGEKSTIRAASKICEKFVSDGFLRPGHLDVTKVSTKRHQPSPRIPRHRIRLTGNNEDQSSTNNSDRPSSANADNESQTPVSRPTVSMKEQTKLWSKRSTLEVDLNLDEDCEYDEDNCYIICKKCAPEVKVKVTISNSNTYSVSNFSRHVNIFHRGILNIFIIYFLSCNV